MDRLIDSGAGAFGDETVLVDGTTWSSAQSTAWALEVNGTRSERTDSNSGLDGVLRRSGRWRNGADTRSW